MAMNVALGKVGHILPCENLDIFMTDQKAQTKL